MVVALGAQLNPRDVLQADQGASGLFHHQVAEGIRVCDVGVTGQAHFGVLATGLAHSGLVVVGPQLGGHFYRRQVYRSQSFRIQPYPQGEGSAQQLGLADARQRLQLRLHNTGQVIGNLGYIHLGAVEGDVHQRGVVTGGGGDHRVFGFCRQHVALTGHLGLDFRQGIVGVVVQHHLGLNGGYTLGAGGRQVINAAGFGNGLLQRRGDKALDQVRTGTGVGGGYRHRGAFQFRVLADLHFHGGPRTEQQDQQADHRGQHWPVDKYIGVFHYSDASWPDSS